MSVEGQACSSLGATQCSSGITYQCAFLREPTLTWVPWFSGGCPGANESEGSIPTSSADERISTATDAPPTATSAQASSVSSLQPLSASRVSFSTAFTTTNLFPNATKTSVTSSISGANSSGTTESDGPNVVKILGIALPTLLALSLILFGVAYWIRKRQANSPPPSDAGQDSYMV
ncbi:hypothetical protein BJ741DRAFT_588372 [Chytriomyces cf. hyalinus JEL632]|nr:hypothetical protein BJ741DRAFT_588372 [Chytriomyces cf. hyalinus JEL632]